MVKPAHGWDATASPMKEPLFLMTGENNEREAQRVLLFCQVITFSEKSKAVKNSSARPLRKT